MGESLDFLQLAGERKVCIKLWVANSDLAESKLKLDSNGQKGKKVKEAEIGAFCGM